ncbi:MAG: hypothetical protein DRP09_20925 [Candidatus Thorarchaeota archaeon]|nr:MAG: hypothetical protein DRP09_20925 [Candidatus Thorarchaeota archaeon]
MHTHLFGLLTLRNVSYIYNSFAKSLLIRVLKVLSMGDILQEIQADFEPEIPTLDCLDRLVEKKIITKEDTRFMGTQF